MLIFVVELLHLILLNTSQTMTDKGCKLIKRVEKPLTKAQHVEGKDKVSSAERDTKLSHEC